MMLERNEYLSDVKCPECGTGFDVCTTHEEHIADVGGFIKCLECGCKFEIRTTIKFEVKKLIQFS